MPRARHFYAPMDKGVTCFREVKTGDTFVHRCKKVPTSRHFEFGRWVIFTFSEKVISCFELHLLSGFWERFFDFENFNFFKINFKKIKFIFLKNKIYFFKKNKFFFIFRFAELIAVAACEVIAVASIIRRNACVALGRYAPSQLLRPVGWSFERSHRGCGCVMSASAPLGSAIC